MKPLAAGAHIHLIAACGTAMGSLAAMLAECGFRITGSDSAVYPPMSDYLRQAGIPVMEGFDASRLEPPPDLIVVGNAVSRGNVEVEATLNRRLPYTSLPEAIRDLFLSHRRPVVACGTHGKTTTTALLAHLLSAAGCDPSFLIAGLPQNFSRPYGLGAGDLFVIEGDEYDSAFFAKFAKFLFYQPETVIINNIEYDHADVYNNLAEIETAFQRLINIVPENGLVLANAQDPVVARLLPRSFAQVQTFGLESGADWVATRSDACETGQSFTLISHGSEFGRFRLPLHGIYNVRNALAAIAASVHLGVSCEQLAAGLESFAGIARRQEVIGSAGGVLFVDDFAHHPTSVWQTLEGLRRAYPSGRLWAVFEPASASNARDIFEERYVDAFAVADRVIVAAVPRPERCGDDPPFQPERLAERLRKGGTEADFVSESADIIDLLRSATVPGDVVVFMSNGGFGGLQRRTLKAIEEAGDAS